eukprot:5225678-Ditylum_brightwellii.AAC.1
MEFIHTDRKGVPTKTTVAEVDADTSKVVLKYIHGRLDIVEPSVIQEALLSKEQGDEGNEMWTFSKILDHRMGNNNKTE